MRVVPFHDFNGLGRYEKERVGRKVWGAYNAFVCFSIVGEHDLAMHAFTESGKKFILINVGVGVYVLRLAYFVSFYDVVGHRRWEQALKLCAKGLQLKVMIYTMFAPVYIPTAAKSLAPLLNGTCPRKF